MNSKKKHSWTTSNNVSDSQNKLNFLAEAIRNVMDILGLTEPVARNVLQQNSWNADIAVQEYLENSSKYQNVAP